MSRVTPGVCPVCGNGLPARGETGRPVVTHRDEWNGTTRRCRSEWKAAQKRAGRAHAAALAGLKRALDALGRSGIRWNRTDEVRRLHAALEGSGPVALLEVPVLEDVPPEFR